MSTKCEENFEVNQIVWAKLTGYPWWPAYINSIDNIEKTLFTVSYLAENSCSQLDQKYIKNFENNKTKFIPKKKIKDKNKLLNSVTIAEKILSGEIELNDHLKYKNFDFKKESSKTINIHEENIMKNVRENKSYNQEQCASNNNEFDDIIQNNLEEINEITEGKDYKNYLSELESKKEDDDNMNRNDDNHMLLNKKRRRHTEKMSDIQAISAEDEEIKKENAENFNNHKDKRKKLKHNRKKNNSIQNNNKGLKYAENKNHNNISSYIESDIPCENSKELSSIDENEKDKQFGRINNNINEDKLFPIELINSHLVSLKSNLNSFNMNFIQIDSDIKSIEAYSKTFCDSGKIDYDDVTKTLIELKDNFKSLYENSINTLHIFNDCIENSKKNSPSHKTKKNSLLLDDIEKLQNIVQKELGDDKNLNKKDNIEMQLASDIDNNNSQNAFSLLKYNNLWIFFKEIITKVFKKNLSKDLMSLKNFHNKVINGNYLIDAIQKLPYIPASKENQKIRTKVKKEIENILLRSVIIYY